MAVYGLKMHFARRKSAAKFLYVKTFSDKVVRHLLAYLTVHKWAVGVICLNVNFVSLVNHPLVWQPCVSALSQNLMSTSIPRWTVLTGVWISQLWSPPFSCSGWPCSSTLQNEIRPKMFCSFWSKTLEFTTIVCSWSITDTDSVLCASENCVILQSARNTSIAPTWQFKGKVKVNVNLYSASSWTHL